MKRLLQIIGIILAVLWVPITSHCAWENVSGLQFFKCAADASPKGDCENDDACSQIESATYKVADPQVALPVPPLTILFQILALEPKISEQSALAMSAPPEIPAGWQFSFRTALPPRAPSFVS